MARPKKQPGEGRTSILQVRLTAAEKAALEAAAQVRGLDTSAWARSQLLAAAAQAPTPGKGRKPRPTSAEDTAS
jgi:hypothetical protein